MGARSKELRSRKVHRFFELMDPQSTDLVLDVGFAGDVDETDASGEFWQKTINPLTQYAPRKLRVLGLTFDDLKTRPNADPDTTFIQADGREMPFRTGSIDYVFSNAVIEHVGTRSEQRRFMEECLRIAKKGVFITTPNRLFLLDPHVGLPFVHYLPRPLFAWVVKKLHHAELASIDVLNALSPKELRSCCPKGSSFHIEGVGNSILPETLVAWAEPNRLASPPPLAQAITAQT